MRWIGAALLCLALSLPRAVAAGEAGAGDAAPPPAPAPAAVPALPPLPDYTQFTIRQTYWLPPVVPPQEPPAPPPPAGPRGMSYLPPPGYPGSRLPAQPLQRVNLGEYSYAAVSMLNADRTRLVTLRSRDTNAYVWDLTRGELIATLQSPLAQLYQAAISPDGRLVMTLADDGNGTLWDVATETVLKRTATTTEDQVFFVSDTQLLWLHGLPNSYGGQPVQWDLELCSLPALAQLSQVGAVAGHELEFGRVTVGKTETDGSVTIYGIDGQATTPVVLCKIPQSANGSQYTSNFLGWPTVVQRRPDGQRLLLLRDNEWEEWALPACTRTQNWGRVEPRRYTPDSRYLAVINSRGFVRTLQFQDPLQQNVTLAAPCGTWQSVMAFSPDGRLVAVAMQDAVHVREIPDQKELGQLVNARQSDPVRAILFPAAADRILLAFDDRVEEWGLETDPLAHESDRAWTVYMDQQGLKHSLFTAVVYGSPAEIKQAIAAHPEWLTAVDADGGTPLMYAVAAGRYDAAEVLLEAGADPNHGDRAGDLPLTLAFQDWNLPMLKLLERHGATVPAGWGRQFYSQVQRSDPLGRRYGRVLLTARQDPGTTWREVLFWLADHDLDADLWQIAMVVHGYERTDLPLAQKIYDRFQRIPIHYLALMQVLLIFIALVRIWRLRQQALDPVKQQEQSAALRVRIYHSSAWGDDSAGQLGLYPEEQRQLAELKHRRDAVLAAPLPMLMGWIGVVAVAAAIPYWWNAKLMQSNAILIALVALSWIFGHLQSTRLRLKMHWLGLITAVAGAGYGVTTALFLPGIADFFAREIYFVAGLSAVPLVVLYVGNLRLLGRIIRMEAQLASVVVHSNEEVRSDSGWDERHPEVF